MNEMKKRIWAWTGFDWAAQPFHTVIITFVFGPYFVSQYVGDEVKGQVLWAQLTLFVGLAVAFFAPVFGAIADQTGKRVKWIFAFSVIYVLGAMFLLQAYPGQVDTTKLLVCGGFLAAYIAIELALVFVNAMLPDIAEGAELGEVSGNAWGIGYLGGLIVLIIFLVFLLPNEDTGKTIVGLTPFFGITVENGGGGRFTGPAAAIWYIVFMIPFFLILRDRPRAQVSAQGAVWGGLQSLAKAVVKTTKTKSLLAFYISSMLYRDALAGLFTFGAVYAAAVLEWPLALVGIFGILTNITGAIGGILGGKFCKWKSSYWVVIWSVIALTPTAFVGLSTNQTHVMFMPVPAGSALPATVFMLAGGVLGAAAGALQGSSRVLVVEQSKNHLEIGEAFGLYAFSGRATAFITPMLVASVTALTQDVQKGAWPIIGLFILSLIVFKWVNKRVEA